VENKALKKEIRRQSMPPTDRPTGKNRAFVDLLKLAETVAPTESTVLITGESGSGKEVVARYIHGLSERAEASFLTVNCGALPEGLLESELFGHVKGSFTGAVRDKIGLFEAANGGTLFLDEIGEMTPATQVRLLRALQEREVIPVGSTEVRRIDVRIMAATNSDLNEEIRRGTFRSDVYYRLNVIALYLPPLRERKDDIPLLANRFLGSLAVREGEKNLEEDTLEALCADDWPGNVRELENALERAVVVASGPEIGVDHLPEGVRATDVKPLVTDHLPPNPSMEVIERAYIQWVLAAEGGNKARAAEVLGIDPSTLYRKLNRYGIEV